MCKLIDAVLIAVVHCYCQSAYNSGKHGGLRELINSGELGKFEIYSGNSCISDGIFL